ncbi:hypothetical protein [Brevirhabdus sp.]|uniref:hypothetical protein n=1 Tax=Brevirhabdus sp. TaxID=2004514 RepID=UPI004059A441
MTVPPRSSAAPAPDATTAAGLAGLYAALCNIDRPILREYSAKVVDGDLRAGRMLLGFPRHALGPGPSQVLSSLCRQLRAPEAGFDLLAPHQSASCAVHFGFEPEDGGAVLKCYLEFAPHAQPAPDLVFLALKWTPDGRYVQSNYWQRDHLPGAQQDALLDAVLPEGARRDSLRALLARCTRPDLLHLLEVEEPGSPRRSLDVNLSDLEATVGEHAATLIEFLGTSEAVQRYVARHAGDRLGHLAAGTTRDGRPFATLYHGVHHVDGALT